MKPECLNLQLIPLRFPGLQFSNPGDVKSGFRQFDLDVRISIINRYPEEILIRRLREQENSTVTIIGKGRIIRTNLTHHFNELINQPEVDYDRQAELLFTLAEQAIAKFNPTLKTQMN